MEITVTIWQLDISHFLLSQNQQIGPHRLDSNDVIIYGHHKNYFPNMLNYISLGCSLCGEQFLMKHCGFKMQGK